MQMMFVPSASSQISTKVSFPFLSISSVQTLRSHSHTDPEKTHGLPWLATPKSMGLGQFLITWACTCGPYVFSWNGFVPFPPPSYTDHPALLLGVSLNKEHPDNVMTLVEL